MDPRNTDEALREATLDIFEGADMLLVKPGLPYLDIVYRLNTTLDMPIFSYQVSGEYAMLKTAVMQSMLDEKDAVLESLICFKRAGSSGIISYFSMQAAKWILNLEKLPCYVVSTIRFFNILNRTFLYKFHECHWCVITRPKTVFKNSRITSWPVFKPWAKFRKKLHNIVSVAKPGKRYSFIC